VDRLILDANVLFSAVYREAAGVTRLWRLPDTELCTSEYAVEEARRNLAEPGQTGRLHLLLRDVERLPSATIGPELRSSVELPEKDWPIVAGALAARATHLITGDLQHFGCYFGRDILGVLVMPPAVYLRSRERP
jgi:uncharacterized protein